MPPPSPAPRPDPALAAGTDESAASDPDLGNRVGGDGPLNPVDHPVLPAIRSRWSPYRFDGREIEPEKLIRCLEAARWAASSYNEQPWAWIIACRQDRETFEEMVECLAEANRVWAAASGALLVTAIRTSFASNGQPNRVALHDLGLAAAHLALQATAEGLQVHQMAGVNLSRVRAQYQVPEGWEPQTAIAIGYAATDPPSDDRQRQLHGRDQGPRRRKPLDEQVFARRFGETAAITRSGH